MKWIVEISCYSLAKGMVGEPVDKTPIIREHDDPISALIDLDNAIDNNEGDIEPLIAPKYLIITPDGRKLPLNAAYEEIFKVKPIAPDNRAYSYPELRKAERKLKKGTLILDDFA